MTVYAQTITNPGAETGDTTGWTSFGDVLYVSTAPDGIGPNSGTYCFGTTNGFSEDTGQYQDIALDSGLNTAIDAEVAALRISGWCNNDGNDTGGVEVSCYDGSAVLLETRHAGYTASSPVNTWFQSEIYMMIPANTRTIRVGTRNFTGGLASRVRWDDFELDVSDTGEVDWPTELALHTQQLGVLVWGTYPTAATEANQVGNYVYAASETSSGLFEVYNHEFGVYAWVRPHGDRRQLRAWTFKQDDHEFYGVNLGTALTAVYDKATGMWSQWRYPGETHWRVEDVTDWEGFNIACDTDTGKLWEIDAEGRLDLGTTPITSIVYGGFTKRFRANDPCYMAELAISEGQPPTGVDASTLGIQLRTSDDGGLSFYNHGTVDGEAIGDAITVRWYGLGLMDKPGRIFEITDSGYARRLDALDIEVGQK